MQIGARQLRGGATCAAAILSLIFLASGCASPLQGEARLAPLLNQHGLPQAGDDHETDNDPQPFDENRSATMGVEAALASAAINGKRVLLVLGGNWCHDSRGLAAKFETPTLSKLLEEYYELVYVDVGHRDRNLDIAKRFGVETLIGTPTILILSADEVLLNAATVHDWRNADSRTLAETETYFRSFVAP